MRFVSKVSNTSGAQAPRKMLTTPTLNKRETFPI